MCLGMVGKHWSAEKVANTFAPTKETMDRVADWLVEFGIDAERHTFSIGTYYLRLLFREGVFVRPSILNELSTSIFRIFPS
jgi:hypothetical protein